MYRLWVWCVALVVALFCAPAKAVVGGAPASPPEPDAAVVFTQRYGLSSRVEGIKDERLGYYSFFGIRYAEPPVGAQRFQRPIRRYLAGEMMATQQCLPCPQPDPYRRGGFIGHEDCLCLNVYAPKMPATEEGSPVVFFIHGGNYRSGSTTPYGGQHLVQKDTILVTAQYRLGSLGYLSTGQRDAGGNVGLFDLHTAMVWIQDYIQFFGGDAKRVVVMGQGSGGSAASLLAMSPEGRSATGVAALSGTPLSPGAVRPDPNKHAEALADHTGCPITPAEALLSCLRELPVEKLVAADEDLDMDMVDTQKFLNDIAGRSGAGARVEGEDDLRGLPPLVAEAPAESLNKKQKRVPFLTGVTSAETARAVFGKYNQFLTNQIQTVKDFLKNDLIGGLQGVVQGVDGLIPANLQTVLPVTDYYQGLFQAATNIVDGLSEIAEATGDALFNFPAYESVQKWSNGGQAFLYSFEHVGNLSKGWHFLPGVPLAEKAGDDPIVKPKKAQGPSHGDELAYIFEPLGADGQPMGGEVSSTDARVRDNFVGLISKFAHGADESKEKDSSAAFGGLFPKSADQFLKIGESLTIDKDFRFCQIGLWGNKGDRLTGALCKNLLGGILDLTKLQLPGQNNLPLVSGQNNLPLVSGQNNLPLVSGQNNVPLVPGLFGQQPAKATKAPQRQPQRTTKPPFRLPFDFLF